MRTEPVRRIAWYAPNFEPNRIESNRAESWRTWSHRGAPDRTELFHYLPIDKFGSVRCGAVRFGDSVRRDSPAESVRCELAVRCARSLHFGNFYCKILVTTWIEPVSEWSADWSLLVIQVNPWENSSLFQVVLFYFRKTRDFSIHWLFLISNVILEFAIKRNSNTIN